MKTRSSLKNIFNILMEKYGSQGWWPVTPIGGCRGDLPEGPVYCIGPKNEKQKLEIILGSLLTQNTGWCPESVKALLQLKILEGIYTDKELAVIQQPEMMTSVMR